MFFRKKIEPPQKETGSEKAESKDDRLDLGEVEGLVSHLLSDELDFDFKKEFLDDGNLVCFSFDFTLTEIDADIIAKIYFGKTGVCLISLSFDDVKDPKGIYPLVNMFNANVSSLRAYIAETDDGTKYLHIDTWCHGINTAETAKDFLNYVFNNLVDDDTIQYLRPLTALTVSE